jgi:hypothetical protein
MSSKSHETIPLSEGFYRANLLVELDLLLEKVLMRRLDVLYPLLVEVVHL